METKGVIYILTNPSFPEYVKIGYADDIQRRLKQLNRSECVPFAFRVYATYEVADRLSDIQIHNIIDSLNPIQHSIIAGNECYRPSFLSKEGISGSKASKENLFAGRNKYVLKGSAGQGKSTVCQFLAQIYRTYFLKTYSANYDEQIEAFYSRLV